MVSAYPVLAIILLRVTPSAKRNSYRVAAAYVVFALEGIMLVFMDVGVAAGAHPSISHRHALHDDSIPHGSKSGLWP